MARPIITSITDSTNSPDDVKSTSPVTLTITFNKAVVVKGPVVELRLSDGSVAVYESGSGTKTLTFEYLPAQNAKNVTSPRPVQRATSTPSSASTSRSTSTIIITIT